MGKKELFIGLGVSMLLVALAPLASSLPDGLEWVAERFGFMDRALEPVYRVMPDYVFPGVRSEALATILSGVVGVALVAGLLAAAAALLQRAGTRARGAGSGR